MATVSTIIGIDNTTGNIKILSDTGAPDTVQIKSITYKTHDGLGAHFFSEFEAILNDYAAKNPTTYQNSITLVLPDYGVHLDSMRLPPIKGKQLSNSIDIAISNLFPDMAEMNINQQRTQTKQYISVALACMPKSLTQGIYTACSPNKMMPKKMTFAANALTQTFAHIHPKLASGSHILVDIKEHFTRISLVCHGRTAGYYSLPFGYSILKTNRLAAEDLLFDHSFAEITVLNAREKAKAKALTVVDDGDHNTEHDSGEAAPSAEEVGHKKQARKLPKFMLRPLPESEEGYVNENFRIFIKWILLYRMRNQPLWEDFPPQAVYVNLPSEFNHVIEYANTEQEENGIEFKLMTTDADKCPKNLLLHPELFGALYANKFNTLNHF